MAIIILPVCFIALFFIWGLYAGSNAKKREILLGSVLLFSALLPAITELLSAFGVLNFSWLFASWSVVTLAALLWLFQCRQQLHDLIGRHQQKTIFTFRRLSLLNKLLLFLVTGILIVLFAQGIIYPPNNWDSMTYHLGRVASWVSHQSVAYYPTHIIRQLYQPPFAEYTVMQAGLLTGSDHLVNAVQFVYLLFAVLAVSGITQLLGLNRFYQVVAAVLAVTIPEVLLQASSTQNDVVVSFFILAAVYFAILAERKNLLVHYCLFGLSTGLALLTKGTAYVYLAPLLLLFAVAMLHNVIKTRNYAYLRYAVVAALICIAVNTINYSRNYQLNGSILGVDEQESKSYANERMTPGLLLSSIVKNSALHLSIKHTGFVSGTIDKAVANLHQMIGISPHDPDVNYHGMPYKAQVALTSEDSAPNPLHFILVLVSMIVLLTCLIKNRLPSIVLFLFLIILLQIIFFCGYLRWQPWDSRLHVPVFM
ncbi:MAG: phospholipid carrier-dependent glycosyltransferase, partial [Sphingobacteriales bacterium]